MDPSLENILSNSISFQTQKFEYIVMFGHLDIIKIYLEQNKDIEKGFKLNRTLYKVCRDNYPIEIVELLLSLGADPIATGHIDEEGRYIYPIHVCNEGVFPLLFKHAMIEFEREELDLDEIQGSFVEFYLGNKEEWITPGNYLDIFFPYVNHILYKATFRGIYVFIQEFFNHKLLILLQKYLEGGLNPTHEWEGISILERLIKKYKNISDDFFFLVIDHLDKPQEINFHGRNSIENYYLQRFSKNVKGAIK